MAYNLAAKEQIIIRYSIGINKNVYLCTPNDHINTTSL